MNLNYRQEVIKTLKMDFSLDLKSFTTENYTNFIL